MSVSVCSLQDDSAFRPLAQLLRCVYVYTVDCEQNGENVVSKGPTASQSTCHGDDNHWADSYEVEIVHLY